MTAPNVPTGQSRDHFITILATVIHGWDDATVSHLRARIQTVRDDLDGWTHTGREVPIATAEWKQRVLDALTKGLER